MYTFLCPVATSTLVLLSELLLSELDSDDVEDVPPLLELVVDELSRPGNLLLHNPITYFNCFGVQAWMHELQVAPDIQCEQGCRAHRNQTLPWDIALLLQCLLPINAHQRGQNHKWLPHPCLVMVMSGKMP